jgi:hypothetical protein
MNKGNKANRNRLMIAGVQKHYGPKDTVLVDGVPTPQPDVVSTLQAAVDADDKTASAEAAYHKTVADGQAASTKADALFLSLKDYFLVIYKKDPTTLKDYGLAPVVKRTPSAATKAAAAAKQKATRALRGTKGKRQKAPVKAPPVVMVPVPAADGQPAATPPAATGAGASTTTKS